MFTDAHLLEVVVQRRLAEQRAILWQEVKTEHGELVAPAFVDTRLDMFEAGLRRRLSVGRRRPIHVPYWHYHDAQRRTVVSG